MFYKKDNEWKTRGVGMIHFKTVDEGTQVILRADNNIGSYYSDCAMRQYDKVK